jgi:hypothetical protein
LVVGYGRIKYVMSVSVDIDRVMSKLSQHGGVGLLYGSWRGTNSANPPQHPYSAISAPPCSDRREETGEEAGEGQVT